MIIYTKFCLKCAYDYNLDAISVWAKQHSENLEVRRTLLSLKWREEAKDYGLKEPFVVIKNKAMEIEKWLKQNNIK